MKKAKFIIKDEVNLKIEGLDPDIRRKLTSMFKYEIPGARFTPAVKLGRWDGKVSYFQLSGSTYINLIPEIIPVIEQSGYQVELVDNRNPPIDFIFNEVQEDYLSDTKWPENHPKAGEPIMLRDYQVGAINMFLQNLQSIQSISTGAGKTIITATLAKTVEKYGRSILIVPSKSLVTQTQEDYINIGLDVGIVYGDKKEFDNKHLICTWQSLNSVLKDDVESFVRIIQDCVCVMVDECHSIRGNVLKDLLTGVFADIPIRWALTGTIPKEQFEFRALQVSIGEVTNAVAASDLQDKGVLAKCSVNLVQLVDYAEFGSYQQEVGYLVTDSKRLEYISGLIEQLEGNTLVLVDRIASGQFIAQNLTNSVFVKGSTKQTERKKEFTEVNFSDSKRIVATYGVAAVGINITKLHNLVLLEPGKSFVRVIQSIGRGLRKGFDKDEVVIWDISSTCKFSKRHLSKRKQYYAEAKYPCKLQKKEWK